MNLAMGQIFTSAIGKNTAASVGINWSNVAASDGEGGGLFFHMCGNRLVHFRDGFSFNMQRIRT